MIVARLGIDYGGCGWRDRVVAARMMEFGDSDPMMPRIASVARGERRMRKSVAFCL
jgi:hypothetical protein